MPEYGTHYSVRRIVTGPVTVTGVLTVLAMAAGPAAVAGPLGSVGAGGWVLAWLLLGLTAGYALSGSV